MTIKTFTQSDDYKILKEDILSLTIEVLKVNLFYRTIVPLSIFEKFIIKVIDRADKNNISLIDVSHEEDIVDVEKIAEISSLDYEIVERNIDKLAKADLIMIGNQKLTVQWNEHLNNWEKELFEEGSEKLYFKNKKSIESFEQLPQEEKNTFFQQRYSDTKRTLDRFELDTIETEEVTLKTFIVLDKESFELKIIFENQDKVFTFSDEITQSSNLKNLLDQEFIVIEKEKIKNNSKIQFSKEQLDVIKSREKYILLKARAGSGKTAVIVERTKQLLKEGINEDEILLLAFNRKASIEMNERVEGDFKSAKTFHSLAYDITKTQEDILQDKKLSTFIQKIIREENNNYLKNYLDMDTEIKDELKELKINFSKQEFIQYVRGNKTLTFKGLNIKSEHKSNGEKYISDFLFEHDIKFEYEKSFNWDNQSYKPDFSIFTNPDDSPNIILEHWGINEKQENGVVPPSWKKTWQEYKEEMNSKREFWKNRDETFLETSIQDFAYDANLQIGGRLAFEKRLKKLLEKNGIVLNKLSDDEIYDRLEFNKILKITKQVEQYISNAKQAKLSPNILSKKIENFKDDERIYYFLKFANKIFQKYEEKKYFENYIDFNDMLLRGIEKMTKDHVSHLKYIMIDEFQDFSTLFFDLIEKIREYNPDVNILAVGDDWQAINGFAGSDLKYFSGFKKYFKSANEKAMLTNYRSPHKIVDFSNKLLEGEASSADKLGGEVFLNQTYSKEFVEKIIKENKNKKIAVLVRMNDEKENIKGVTFETVHKSKGLQYDIVIIKDASKFEYLHPDNKLLEIFDKKEEDFIEENKRLFYVAVTRAKEKLYVCGEK